MVLGFTPTRPQWFTLNPGSDPATAWRTRRVIAVRDVGFTEIAQWRRDAG